MPYTIAGIDVHKRMLVVVVSDVEVHDEYQFERRQLSSNPAQLRLLAAWLIEQQVEEVVMESTAQYWKPVWGALERHWQPACQQREGARPTSGRLHLAGAVEPRAAWAQERFRRRGTAGQAVGRERTHAELCACGRTAFVADGDAHQVPVAVQPGTGAEPLGGAAGRGAY